MKNTISNRATGKPQVKEKKKIPVTEVVNEMTPEELEAFKMKRLEKFIKPFLDRNLEELKKNK